ncbi:MAG: hypothetical protein ACERJ2_05640 [Filomicrobium sp.]
MAERTDLDKLVQMAAAADSRTAPELAAAHNHFAHRASAVRRAALLPRHRVAGPSWAVVPVAAMTAAVEPIDRGSVAAGNAVVLDAAGIGSDPDGDHQGALAAGDTPAAIDLEN